MRRNRIIGYALGIVAIVSVFAFPLLRSSTVSIGDFVTLAFFCLFGIAIYVVQLNRSHKEMDKNEIRIAASAASMESPNAIGILKIGSHQLSFNQRRAVVGVVLIPFLLCGANQLFDLGFLGTYGKAAWAICAVVLFLAIHFVGPTVAEMQEYRARRRVP